MHTVVQERILRAKLSKDEDGGRALRLFQEVLGSPMGGPVRSKWTDGVYTRRKEEYYGH